MKKSSRLSYLSVFSFVLLTLAASLSAYYEEPWGKDQELMHALKTKEEPKNSSILSKAANAIIRFHQEIISPIDGPRSHFRPSSSRYMQLAIQRYGFVRGYLMGCDRLLRENEEKWVYRIIRDSGGEFKYDPAVIDKFSR